MKIIFGIVASDDEIYSEFKKIWINAIVKIKRSNLSDIIDFYFLYSDKHNTSKSVQFTDDKKEVYIDFYDNSEIDNENDEINKDAFVTKTILSRTIYFFNYIKHKYSLDIQENYNKCRDDGFFIVRTNLSTMFDFKKVVDWFNDKPKTNFFGGSINGFYNEFYTTFSGTNLVFSIDVMLHLLYNKHRIQIDKFFEDEAMSLRVLHDIHVNIINIKRIDFIEMEEVTIKEINHVWPATPNSVTYHKANIGDNTIFCFRFKTFNRKNDINTMTLLVDKMFDDNFNLYEFIDTFCNSHIPQLPRREEAANYGSLYSEKPFKIANTPKKIEK